MLLGNLQVDIVAVCDCGKMSINCRKSPHYDSSFGLFVPLTEEEVQDSFFCGHSLLF